jgi:hypothetical protein
MFPFIVPIMLHRSEPVKPPRCRHCGKDWPISRSQWGWMDTAKVMLCTVALLLALALFAIFIGWTIDRDYGPHQGQHFVPYMVDAICGFWRMLQDLV